MSVPSSSAMNLNPEDSLGNQPLLNSASCKSSPGESNEVASKEHNLKRHLNSPKISIGHVYVYNFSPSAQPVDTVIEFPSPAKAIVKTKQVSPTASSGPFCRICHEGDVQEDLLSPCYCTGTVGLVHMSCIEKWLGASGSDKCEICHYTFTTVRYPKSFTEWLRSSSTSSGQKTLGGDVTCFLLLTPLAAVSGFLSIDGALKQVRWQNSMEAGCLMALATFLITVYFIWSVLTFRYHMKNFLSWRRKNQHVKILIAKRISSSDGHFLSSSRQRNNRHSIATPRIHQQRPTRQTTGPENSNEIGPTATSEIHSNENRTPIYTQYGFNRSEFVEQMAAMFETAL